MIKEGLIKNNQEINWVPENLKNGRMGQWLLNARDWAISRNRFWGTPIPVWECNQDEKHREIFGSVEALAKRANVGAPKDLHKEFIDPIHFRCKVCGGTMHRIPEVFDCWFESGSMPYAQKHYPFQNSQTFEKTFPADFIAEGQDQTRGWFYTLSILSEALFKKKAFKNVIVNGLVLAADGKKMSKRLGNYTPPDLLLEEFGADSIRLYMLNSPVIRGENLKFANEGVKETIRSVLLPYWNAYSFLSTYAEADQWQPEASLFQSEAPRSKNELDSWIISRLHTLLKEIEAAMNEYKLYQVIPALLAFIEDLTNWYIRLSRRRFWTTDSELSEDSLSAYKTLTFVLAEFSKVFAPYAPFLADHVYRGLSEGVNGTSESVHLCLQPRPSSEFIKSELEEKFAAIRKATEMARSLRAKHQIRTRQVLRSIEVISSNLQTLNYIKIGENLLKEELNVKEVKYATNENSYVKYAVKPNLKVLGKRLGSRLGELKKYLDDLNGITERTADFLVQLKVHGSVSLLGEEFSESDFIIDRTPLDARPMASDPVLSVLLDTTLTDDLVKEGLSREIISRIQKLRKESQLNVSDRIEVTLLVEEPLATAAESFKTRICEETLAIALKVASIAEISHSEFNDLEIEDHEGYVKIAKV